MIMKKIFSLIIVLNMILMTTPGVMAGFSDVDNSEAVDTLQGLKIMEGYSDGTFLPDSNLTRAEFAQIIANIYTYGEENDSVAEWKENFFEGIFDENDFIPPEQMKGEESEVFDDVYKNSDYYDAIKLVADKKIMVGLGDNLFDPDGNVTVEQALKVITTMMGYGYTAEAKGGYPVGYTAVAAELKLTKNVGNYSSYATRLDIANIIFNAFDVELMQIKFTGGETYYQTVEGETFLTKLLNIDYDEGRMTDNGITTLSEAQAKREEYVIINNINYFLPENNEYARDYIGRDVRVYYSLDDDSSDELLYVSPVGKDEIISFNISEFIEYSDDRITYRGEDGKEKHINITKAPFFIRNGSAKPSFDVEDFRFDYGTVTVIKRDKSNLADLIMVKTMQNFNVAFVDLEEQVIYSNSSVIGASIDLDCEENETFLRIYNSAGELKDISVLTAGSITTVCLGEKVTEIYVSDNAVNNYKLSSISTNDNDETVISDGKNSYVVSKDYENASGFLPRIGNVYNLKLDILGNIVEAKQVSGDYQMGFINKVRIVNNEETFNEELMVKYYDLSIKKIETAYFGERIKIIDTEGISKSYKLPDAMYAVEDLLTGYITQTVDGEAALTGALVRFKTDENGMMTEIELAGVQENSNDDSERLVEIKIDKNYANYNLYNGGSIIGGKAIIPKNAAVLQCNYELDSFNSDSGYVLTDRTAFKEGETYNLRMYSTIKNSPVAEYIVYTSDPTQMISTKAPHTVGIVVDSYTALNIDDEIVTYLELSETAYEVEETALAEGKVTNMQGASFYTDSAGNKKFFEVEKGDIIRYALSGEGKINQIQLVYDADADYSEGITLGGVIYNGWSEKGNLAGCIDGYNVTQYKYSNPFSANSTINGNEFAADSYAWTYYNAYMRVMLGTVVRAGSNYIITSTRNLAENPGTVEDNGVYTLNTWERSSVTLVTVGKKNVTVQTLPVTSLRTYETNGENCDRIFITSRLGRDYNSIVYRYE